MHVKVDLSSLQFSRTLAAVSMFPIKVVICAEVSASAAAFKPCSGFDRAVPDPAAGLLGST